MGGERASTTRRRERGQLCCFCGIPVQIPPCGFERGCDTCLRARGKIRVLLCFQRLVSGCPVTWLESDARTCAGRGRNLRTIQAVRGLIERTNPHRLVLADFDRQVQHWGRGSVWLELTEEQRRRLW